MEKPEIMKEAKEILEKFNYFKVTVLKEKHIVPQYFIAQSCKCDIDGDINLSCCCSAVSRYRAETAEKINDHAFLFKNRYETVCVAGYHNPLFDNKKECKSTKNLQALIDPYRSRISENGITMIVLDMWGQWRTWSEANYSFYHWMRMNLVRFTAINDRTTVDIYHKKKKNRTVFFLMKPNGDWRIGLYDLEKNEPISLSYCHSIKLDHGYENIINDKTAKKMCEIFQTMQPQSIPTVSEDDMPYIEITANNNAGTTLEKNIEIRENFYREQLEAHGYVLEKKPVNAAEYHYFVYRCYNDTKRGYYGGRYETIDELEERCIDKNFSRTNPPKPKKEIITDEYYQVIYSIVDLSRNKPDGYLSLKELYDDLKKSAGAQLGKVERQICITYYYANPENQLYGSLIQNEKEVCRTLLCYRNNGWITESQYSFYYLRFDKKIAVHLYKIQEAERITVERQRIKEADAETEKVRVRKLRRRLESQNYTLEKSSARKKFTEYDQGLFRIVDSNGNIKVGHCFDATLRECEKHYELLYGSSEEDN